MAAMTMRAMDSEDFEGQSFQLEGDLYSLALLSFTDVPEQHKRGNGKLEYELPGGRLSDRIWSMTVMVVVTSAQLLLSYTIFLHVRNDLMDSKTRPIQTAYEIFIGNNWTIPISVAEALCGTWEDIETHKDVAAGPLSKIIMPDGVTFSGGVNYPMFYNLKQPTRTWDYGRLGVERSIIDDVMYVIAEGVSMNPFTPSGYSVMFVLMISMFSFSILIEFRKIYQFLTMLINLPDEPRRSPRKDDDDDDSIRLTWLSPAARSAGYTALFCWVLVTVVVGLLGVLFLAFTTVKIDLILNGLAIMFVIELDNAIYAATVPYRKAKMIEELEPVVYSRHRPTRFSGLAEVVLPILFFPCALGVGLLCRTYQVKSFTQTFNMAAPICMFAGPTPGGYKNFDKLVGPVAGFCDSLLGVTCAGRVTPSSAAKEHGYCVITDQTPAAYPNIQMYVDDTFPGRYNPDGSSKSWVHWGTVNTWPWSSDEKSLYEKGHWMNGPFQNLMRRNCVQMYRKVPPADLMSDPGMELMTDGAPFMCDHDEIVEAVFGRVRQDFLLAARHAESGIDTLKAIGKVRTLTDPKVIQAIDRCNSNDFEQFSEEHAQADDKDAHDRMRVRKGKHYHSFIHHSHHRHDKFKSRAGKRKLRGVPENELSLSDFWRRNDVDTQRDAA